MFFLSILVENAKNMFCTLYFLKPIRNCLKNELKYIKMLKKTVQKNNESEAKFKCL